MSSPLCRSLLLPPLLPMLRLMSLAGSYAVIASDGNESILAQESNADGKAALDVKDPSVQKVSLSP